MRALEFYSGIGGMHYALQEVFPSAEVVGAFDINDLANDVYEHNFKFRPKQGTLSSITAAQLDRYAAEIWMLSPPCQPYTRRGARRDADDPRASSFLHLISLLQHLKVPPEYILVENVVGFEGSQTRDQLARSLAATKFCLQEFLLTPLQLGIPYSRPRYYAIARRIPADGSAPLLLRTPESGLPFRVPPSHLLAHVCEEPPEGPPGSVKGPAILKGWTGPAPPQRSASDMQTKAAATASSSDTQYSHKQLPSTKPDGASTALPCCFRAGQSGACGSFPHVGTATNESRHEEQGLRALLDPTAVAPLSDYLVSLECGGEACWRETAPAEPLDGDVGPGCGNVRVPHASHVGIPHGAAGSSGGEGTCGDPFADFWLPHTVLQQWGQALDIVSPASRRCNCFTKTYSRYTKGSGSVLATRNLHTLQFAEQKEMLAPGDMDLQPQRRKVAEQNGGGLLSPDWALDAQRIIAVPTTTCKPPCTAPNAPVAAAAQFSSQPSSQCHSQPSSHCCSLPTSQWYCHPRSHCCSQPNSQCFSQPSSQCFSQPHCCSQPSPPAMTNQPPQPERLQDGIACQALSGGPLTAEAQVVGGGGLPADPVDKPGLGGESGEGHEGLVRGPTGSAMGHSCTAGTAGSCSDEAMGHSCAVGSAGPCSDEATEHSCTVGTAGRCSDEAMGHRCAVGIAGPCSDEATGHSCILGTTGPCSDEALGSQDLSVWLGSLGLRYFTPREIANLHSFPQHFTFPSGVSFRQQCALLGNSLSVAVVAHLLRYLLYDRWEPGSAKQ
eukprot:jgi/Botrbrau1/12561/Bobra.0169s0096.1